MTCACCMYKKSVSFQETVVILDAKSVPACFSSSASSLHAAFAFRKMSSLDSKNSNTAASAAKCLSMSFNDIKLSRSRINISNSNEAGRNLSELPITFQNLFMSRYVQPRCLGHHTSDSSSSKRSTSGISAQICQWRAGSLGTAQHAVEIHGFHANTMIPTDIG